MQQLLVYLLRVKCMDETGGKWAERVGNDEISLSGFGIDASGQTVMIPPFRVYSEFDDGDVKEFSPPQTLLTLNVPSEGTFPKTCVASFILAEVDTGGLTELAQKAFAKVTEEMETKADAQENGGTSSNDIDWGGIWAEVKPYLYGYVKDLISSGLDDDVFPLQETSLTISSADFYWGDGTKLSPEHTLEFRAHNGVYYLTYYWEIRTV